MPLFKRNKKEETEEIQLKNDDWTKGLSKTLGQNAVSSGEIVNEETAFDASPFAAAVRLIYNQGSKYDLQVINKKTNKVADNINVAWLRKAPCLGVSLVQWKKIILASLAVRGVAFMRIENWVTREKKRYPDVLKPLHTRYITTSNTSNSNHVEVVYSPDPRDRSKTETLTEWLGPDDTSIHKTDGEKNRCLIIRHEDDGTIEGRNPLIASSSVLGVALAAQNNASLYFKNGGEMTGIISLDDASPEQLLKQKVMFYKDKKNENARGGVLFTNVPVNFVEMSLNAQQQQLIESRAFSVDEISRLYNIPSQMIGASNTNWGTGMQAIERFTHNYAIVPYLQTFSDHLSWTVPRSYGVEFNAHEHIYDDPRTSTEILTKLVAGNIITVNEARERIRLSPIDGGDVIIGLPEENDEDDSFEKDDKANYDADKDKSGKDDN